jgi:hypothetical protein
LTGEPAKKRAVVHEQSKLQPVEVIQNIIWCISISKILESTITYNTCNLVINCSHLLSKEGGGEQQDRRRAARQSREQRAESREQQAESSKQRAESREQQAESREQRAASREQRA